MGTLKEIKARQVQKHDTKTNWEIAGQNGFVPEKGEFIIYDKSENAKEDEMGLKIGDGKTTVNNLPFVHASIKYVDWSDEQ